MTYPEKLEKLANAMAEQNDLPVFDGDKDEALTYVQQFNDTIMAFYNSVVAVGFSKHFPSSTKALEENEKERLIAQDAASAALENMNYVCKAYNVEPLADIDCRNPEKILAFTEDYRDQLLQKGIDMLKKERDSK